MPETKHQTARRLPVGTWFVWPTPTLPQRGSVFRMRVYRVNAGGRVSKPVFESVAMSDDSAAFQACAEIARLLNEQRADEREAWRFIEEKEEHAAAMGIDVSMWRSV